MAKGVTNILTANIFSKVSNMLNSEQTVYTLSKEEQQQFHVQGLEYFLDKKGTK